MTVKLLGNKFDLFWTTSLCIQFVANKTKIERIKYLQINQNFEGKSSANFVPE